MHYHGLPLPEGLYHPEHEHDACGVGFVVNIQGKKSHAIVEQGIQILENLVHRGASGSDPETGDGAGILIQIPHHFFLRVRDGNLPDEGYYGVGMVFLPRDERDRALCEAAIETVTKEEGQLFLGWREVPVDNTVIGRASRAVEPVIKQFFIGRAKELPDQEAFERKLFVTRKVIENRVARLHLKQPEYFYICSLSSRTIVYKGLLLAHQISGFYLDLAEPDVVTALALVHQRFSTNTFPTWPLAHPYRMIAHNGEINTLRGNLSLIHI
jgi:glutamate synthase domain-containing protein 1